MDSLNSNAHAQNAKGLQFLHAGNLFSIEDRVFRIKLPHHRERESSSSGPVTRRGLESIGPEKGRQPSGQQDVAFALAVMALSKCATLSQ